MKTFCIRSAIYIVIIFHLFIWVAKGSIILASSQIIIFSLFWWNWRQKRVLNYWSTNKTCINHWHLRVKYLATFRYNKDLNFKSRIVFQISRWFQQRTNYEFNYIIPSKTGSPITALFKTKRTSFKFKNCLTVVLLKPNCYLPPVTKLDSLFTIPALQLSISFICTL